MPRDMFGDVVDPSIKMGNKAWYTVPLTMFLDSTGAPFWGGTYFPPTSRYGRPGFIDVLR